jgi:hypothetical protein
VSFLNDSMIGQHHICIASVDQFEYACGQDKTLVSSGNERSGEFKRWGLINLGQKRPALDSVPFF